MVYSLDMLTVGRRVILRKQCDYLKTVKAFSVCECPLLYIGTMAVTCVAGGFMVFLENTSKATARRAFHSLLLSERYGNLSPQ